MTLLPAQINRSNGPVPGSRVRTGHDDGMDVTSVTVRLTRLCVAAGPLEHVPGAIDYFDFADPDGNQLSLYPLLS